MRGLTFATATLGSDERRTPAKREPSSSNFEFEFEHYVHKCYMS